MLHTVKPPVHMAGSCTYVLMKESTTTSASMLVVAAGGGRNEAGRGEMEEFLGREGEVGR